MSWSRLSFGKSSLGYTVQDRSALGPGFLFKPSISIRPGPFGSGGLFFVWDEFLLVRLQEPVFFSLERNIIVFAV